MQLHTLESEWGGVFYPDSYHEEGCLSSSRLFFLLAVGDCACLCQILLGKFITISIKLLWSCRTEVRVQLWTPGQEKETHFKHSDSGLVYSFAFNLFSFMSNFANRIFAVCFVHRKVNAFRPFSP